MDIPCEPFTARQAAMLGLTPMRLRDLVSAGLLRHPLHGVYCPAGIPDTLALRAQCVARALPRHAVVCDRSAAWLHGVDCLAPFEIEVQAPPIEVVSVDAAGSRADGVYGGKRTLAMDEIMRIDGVPVTTPVRTAIDLACLRSGSRALAVVESFMRSHALDRAALERQLVRHRGRRGVVQARQVVALATQLSESPAESWTKWWIIRSGLPAPEQQVELDVPGWGWVRLDFAYPALKIAVEYDGEAFHGPERTDADRLRREALMRGGWVVFVLRKSDLTTAAREQWLAALGSALAERMPLHRRAFPRKTPRQA